MNGSNKYQVSLTYGQMCNVYNLLDNKIREVKRKKGDMYYIDLKIYEELKEKFKCHSTSTDTSQH